MAAKDDLGRAGEDRAAAHLRAHGYELLDRNWRCTDGEIDIVALQAHRLCIVEVKTRRSIAYGHPFEAVDEPKIRRLWRLAHAWQQAHPEQARGRVLRVELVGITGADPATGTLDHIEDLR